MHPLEDRSSKFHFIIYGFRAFVSEFHHTAQVSRQDHLKAEVTGAYGLTIKLKRLPL